MFKACSRCGKIHPYEYDCRHNKITYQNHGTSEERQLRNLAKWHRKSEEVREKAQNLCEVCRDKGVYKFDGLEVHHIMCLREDKTGLLDNGNLVCLCTSCHKLADAGMIDREYLKELAIKREENYKNPR